MRQLYVTFQSQAPDPNSGSLKNQEKISQFCACASLSEKIIEIEPLF